MKLVLAVPRQVAKAMVEKVGGGHCGSSLSRMWLAAWGARLPLWGLAHCAALEQHEQSR